MKDNLVRNLRKHIKDVSPTSSSSKFSGQCMVSSRVSSKGLGREQNVECRAHCSYHRGVNDANQNAHGFYSL